MKLGAPFVALVGSVLLIAAHAQPRFEGAAGHYNLDREGAFNAMHDKVKGEQEKHQQKLEAKQIHKKRKDKQKFVKNVEKVEKDHAKTIERRLGQKKKRDDGIKEDVKKKDKARAKKQKHAEYDRKRAEKEAKRRRMAQSARREL